MGLPVYDQLKYWGLAAFVSLTVLWFLSDVIAPFLVGGAVAYFLDPVADRLEKLGLSRISATSVISLLALIVFAILILMIVPLLFNQLSQLVNEAPAMVARLQDFMLAHFPELTDHTSTLRQSLGEISKLVQSKGMALANSLINSALSLVGIVVFIVIVPVVAFYLLLDWDKMTARIDDVLPRDHAPVIRRLAGEINAVLAAFVRGQLSVCVVLGLFYTVTLMMAGLQYGAVVGAIAGAITFIPYVGALVGGMLAIGLALFQFWGDWFSVAMVAGIFGLGQFLEGNVITPKLVGNSVGLHPVWLMFSLSAFGAVFGFVGMLIAVPVAASLGVLARFGIEQYKQSRLYKGHHKEEYPQELNL